MFSLQRDPIEASSEAASHAEGALVCFEGIVRNRNEGRDVIALEYEAFDELALSEGESVLEEALRRFEVCRASCVHRVGKLQLGEVAVRVEVGAGHRDEAFAACRFIIDEIKRRVPIWKKEHYADGETEWLTPKESDPSLAITSEAFYNRQMRLSEVGAEGQLKLDAAKVLVVGTGGLGSPVLLYLAAAGVGTLGIVEDDKLSIDNLHRQIIYKSGDAGKPKAKLAQKAVQDLNPLVNVIAHKERLNSSNGPELTKGYDILVDCTDNFAAKFLLNDLAVTQRKLLVQASIYRYEGQINVYDPDSDGACLRCLWPEEPESGCVGSCAEVGVLGATAGFFGSLQAVEVLKLILGIGIPLAEQTLLVDLLTFDIQRLDRRRNPLCPVCSSHAKPSITESIEIGFSDLRKIGAYKLIDIREAEEIEETPIGAAEWIPMMQLHPDLREFKSGAAAVLVCEHGIRSLRAAKWLRGLGVKEVYSLVGGRDRYARELKQLQTAYSEGNG